MDSIHVEILSDGTLKITTEGIGTANHRNADDLLRLVDQLMGGVTASKRNPVARSHRHNSTHNSTRRHASNGR